MTEDDAVTLEELAYTDGPLDWVPVGRAELQELLSAWRGQQAVKAQAKHAPSVLGGDDDAGWAEQVKTDRAARKTARQKRRDK